MIKKIKNESKVKIRINDIIIVNSGVEKGKKGKVLTILRADNKLVAQGINIRTKHVKAKKQGQESGILKMESPIYIDKVNYFCEKCSKGVRLGTIIKDGKKIRVCKKCNTEIK